MAIKFALSQVAQRFHRVSKSRSTENCTGSSDWSGLFGQGQMSKLVNIEWLPSRYDRSAEKQKKH